MTHSHEALPLFVPAPVDAELWEMVAEAEAGPGDAVEELCPGLLAVSVKFTEGNDWPVWRLGLAERISTVGNKGLLGAGVALAAIAVAANVPVPDW